MSAHDDILDRATAALRDSAVPSVDEGAFTLARVQRSLAPHAPHTSRTRRRISRFVLLPIAAVLVATGAFAGATGRLPRLFAQHGDPQLQREPHGEAPSSPPPPSPAVAVAALPSATETVAPTPPEPETSARAPRRAMAPRPSASRPRIDAPVDADVLYREAHAAHFARRDYAAAIPAWDRYLAAAGPGGRFVLEARYNRAIALARSGRRAEAALALRPFANGDFGGYRRDEAQALLATLD
jgi:hypothetical protein